ncbi:MAG: hypothetical protein JWL64_618 [Frankiales bacterium]|nr:hypothetical protein [Frankiales bacterium]
MTSPTEHNDPADTRDEGPARLADRTAPGGQGAPAANQQKTEPQPVTPREAPEPGDISVGAADPQAPSHPWARDRDGADPAGGGSVGDPADVAVPSTEAAPGTSEERGALGEG